MHVYTCLKRLRFDANGTSLSSPEGMQCSSLNTEAKAQVIRRPSHAPNLIAALSSTQERRLTWIMLHKWTRCDLTVWSYPFCRIMGRLSDCESNVALFMRWTYCKQYLELLLPNHDKYITYNCCIHLELHIKFDVWLNAAPRSIICIIY